LSRSRHPDGSLSPHTTQWSAKNSVENYFEDALKFGGTALWTAYTFLDAHWRTVHKPRRAVGAL